jgi:hypothetical protein
VPVGTDVLVQADPFHEVAHGTTFESVAAQPTIMHVAGVVHETLNGNTVVSPLGLVNVVVVHADPFHVSAIAWLLPPTPTATQNETLTHDTPCKAAIGVEASTTSVQAEPFHCSMSGAGALEKVAKPAAMQKEVVTQEIPLRLVAVAEGTVGRGSSDQVVPFHSWAKPPAPSSVMSPTAMQKTDVTHETRLANWSELVAVAVFGIVDQVAAVTCAGTVNPWEVAAPAAGVASVSSTDTGNASRAAAAQAVRTRTSKDRMSPLFVSPFRAVGSAPSPNPP